MTSEERKEAKKKITIDYIRDYCRQSEDRKAWYNETITTLVPVAVFPKGADGKQDKTQQPTTEMRKPSFIQIQAAFITKYMPELLAPKKDKKENMYTPL